jgi:transcriptional regulator with XRE-family HTH domain
METAGANMKNTAVVGSRIRALRESKKITAEQVAERSGLSLEQLDRIENDMNLPSLTPLIRIARALGVRLGTFLDDSDSLGPDPTTT